MVENMKVSLLRTMMQNKEKTSNNPSRNRGIGKHTIVELGDVKI